MAKQGSGEGMLVLTRKPGEKIMIGDEITVVVLSMNGNQVKIGINAPREMRVHREEVYDKINARSHSEGHALDAEMGVRR